MKVVVPSNRCGLLIAGEEQPMRQYLDSCVALIRQALDGQVGGR